MSFTLLPPVSLAIQIGVTLVSTVAQLFLSNINNAAASFSPLVSQVQKSMV